MRMLTLAESACWLQCLYQRRRNFQLSRPDLERLQQQRFRKLVTRAFHRSPYYRELMQDRSIDPATCRPEDFPVLTKTEVMENFDRIVTDPTLTRRRITEFLDASKDPNELLDGKYYVLHTSGTSGSLGYNVYSKTEWIHGASQITHLVKPGFRKRMAYVAATRGHFAGVSLARTGENGTNAIFYNTRSLDANLPMRKLVEELNAFRPQVLSGYTAMLKALAENQVRGVLQIQPRLICSGGEPISSEDRAWIQHVFQAPVANAYACSENLYMGIGFPNSPGMVLFEDNIIFEFASDHVRTTNLFNHTLPLIRYVLNDVVEPDHESPRMNNFTVIKDVVGRYEDALSFENRFGEVDFIHPIVIVELCIKGLVGWQVVIRSSTSFTLRSQFARDLTSREKEVAREEVHEQLMSLLIEKDMDNVLFDIEEVQALTIDEKSGKFRLVVREPVEKSTPV